MTEVVPELEEDSGRSRVQITLIKAAVPVLIAVVGVVTHLVNDRPASAAASTGGGAVAAPIAAPPPEAPSPRRWKITGRIQAQEGRSAAGISLRLFPIEHLVEHLEVTTDDQGKYIFPDVHPGVYTLIYNANGDDGWTVLILNKSSTEPREDVPFPDPLELAIIEK